MAINIYKRIHFLAPPGTFDPKSDTNHYSAALQCYSDLDILEMYLYTENEVVR